MRFFRFLAALNVFATVRDLRAELAEAKYLNSLSADTITFHRLQRDFFRDRCDLLSEAVEQADQALSTFMDERSDLNAAIAAFMDERADHKDALATAHATGIVLTASLIDATAAADQQTRETLEVIDYVKQVEARLVATGISIVDGDAGPLVVVNQDAFMSAVRGATHKTGPDITLAA